MTRLLQNRKQHRRRAIYGLLLVLAALLQHTKGVFVFGNARAFLILPLCIAISMQERSVIAMLFGVLGGVLWDEAAASGDGFYAVVLCILCFVTGALCSFVLRRNLRACLLLNVGALALLCLAHWFFFLFLKGYDPTGALLLRRELPSAALTFVFAPILYWIVSAVQSSDLGVPSAAAE